MLKIQPVVTIEQINSRCIDAVAAVMQITQLRVPNI
jgi:hypothetical protein